MSPILQISPELQLQIFDALPCIRDAIRLQQTCKHFNQLFKNYQRSIITTQLDRMIRPITQYYRLLLTLNLKSEYVEFPDPAWQMHNRYKNDFANYVMQRIPYVKRGNGARILDLAEPIDWRVDPDNDFNDDDDEAYHGQDEIIPHQPRYQAFEIALTSGRGIILNVLTGMIWYADLRPQQHYYKRGFDDWNMVTTPYPNYSCLPHDEFWEMCTKLITEGDMVLLPAGMQAIWPRHDPRCEHPLFKEEAIDRMLEVYKKAGWPRKFDDAALSAVYDILRDGASYHPFGYMGES